MKYFKWTHMIRFCCLTVFKFTWCNVYKRISGLHSTVENLIRLTENVITLWIMFCSVSSHRSPRYTWYAKSNGRHFALVDVDRKLKSSMDREKNMIVGIIHGGKIRGSLLISLYCTFFSSDVVQRWMGGWNVISEWWLNKVSFSDGNTLYKRNIKRPVELHWHPLKIRKIGISRLSTLFHDIFLRIDFEFHTLLCSQATVNFR